MSSDSPPDTKKLTNAERTDLARYSSPILALPAVIGVVAPYVDVYIADRWHWGAIPVIGAFSAVGIRGVQSLAYAELRAARPYSIRLGSIVAMILLLASPEAIRLAVVNFPVRPVWLFTSMGGAILAAVYLVAAFRSRKGRSLPSDTSPERTSEE